MLTLTEPVLKGPERPALRKEQAVKKSLSVRLRILQMLA